MLIIALCSVIVLRNVNLRNVFNADRIEYTRYLLKNKESGFLYESFKRTPGSQTPYVNTVKKNYQILNLLYTVKK